MDNKSVLFLGFYDPTSPRTHTLKKDYEDDGFEVLECRTDKKGFFPKCFDLIKKYKKYKNQISEVCVLFPGHHLMPLVWILTRFPRKKLTFDVFISVYDTLVGDRKKVSKWNPAAWFYYLIDFVSCHLADEILIDTKTHRDFFIQKFKIHPKRISVVYLETRKDLFVPDSRFQRPDSNDHFTVFFYGSFIPLQGIDTILRSAKIIQDKNSPIKFKLLGAGQTKPGMIKLKTELNLNNTEFLDFVPLEELPRHINSSDLCLGIFGTSDKAQRVIPHKVLDYLACGKKVITANSPAILERFANNPDVILCEAGNAEELAKLILSQKTNG
ncbi:glycosyltransferase [Patescibacteria group bacterium]|nr:glycosyltransferase [Patescibacteria group bacterium]MBU1124159.1 glycosyltransferase [Patescibacteria group bacterium]MBU1911467.1 glycosyltransferase [Patescibacteria group bacterium]